jgi:CHAT domain-containing protein
MTPLPSAEREIRTLAREYDHPRMVLGGAADPTTTIAAFREATILHYAGHAIVDDRRPEQSYLVLASGDSTGTQRLTANQLRSLDLRHTRLVVLAACETLSPNAARGGGYRGFASALRAAGAQGIVGSLWRVDDDATSTLMVAFHHAYRESKDAAEALRSAQVRLLRGSKATERSPASWAGFQYMGT